MPNKMTLEKAKEILSLSVTRGNVAFDRDFRLAQKIGIEAIHRIQAYRLNKSYISMMPLPSEER